MMRDVVYYGPRDGQNVNQMMDWNNPSLALNFIFHMAFGILALVILVLIAMWLWEKVKSEKKNNSRSR